MLSMVYDNKEADAMNSQTNTKFEFTGETKDHCCGGAVMSLDHQFHITQRRLRTGQVASPCGQSVVGRLFIRTRRAANACLAPFSASVEIPDRWSFRSKDMAAYTPPSDLERRHDWERRFAAYRSVS